MSLRHPAAWARAQAAARRLAVRAATSCLRPDILVTESAQPEAEPQAFSESRIRGFAQIMCVKTRKSDSFDFLADLEIRNVLYTVRPRFSIKSSIELFWHLKSGDDWRSG